MRTGTQLVPKPKISPLDLEGDVVTTLTVDRFDAQDDPSEIGLQGARLVGTP